MHTGSPDTQACVFTVGHGTSAGPRLVWGIWLLSASTDECVYRTNSNYHSAWCSCSLLVLDLVLLLKTSIATAATKNPPLLYYKDHTIAEGVGPNCLNQWCSLDYVVKYNGEKLGRNTSKIYRTPSNETIFTLWKSQQEKREVGRILTKETIAEKFPKLGNIWKSRDVKLKVPCKTKSKKDFTKT